MSAAPARPSGAVEAARAWLRRAAQLPDEGLHAWTARIGGVSIRFRCSDPALAVLYRSRLTGLDPEPCDEPVLALDLLETERLGWPDPREEVERRQAPDDEAAGLRHARLAALMPAPDDPVSDYPWVVFDPSTGRGVTLVRDAGALPPWTDGAPFALALHLAFAWRGWRFMHAATLGSEGRGALLVGPGGAGKSGTTLAGLAHGLVTAGDDYVVVEPGDPPVAWPVYRVLKQDRAGLVRIGREELAARTVNWHGKVELDMDEAFPGGQAGSLRLERILLPARARARRTTVTPASPTEAFSAIAASMLSQLPGARRSGFEFLTRLTRRLPAHHLALSTDAGDIAAAVRELIER